MEWYNYISPFLLFIGTLLGWWFGRRKQNVEIESISVSASKVALEALLSTVEPLRQEIADLKTEVEELKGLNAQLVSENESLAESVKQLRRLVQTVDDYPEFYKNSPAWGGEFK